MKEGCVNRRGRLLAAAALVTSLLVTSVAVAAKSQERVRDRFEGPYSFAVDCAPYGHAFEILVDGSERGTITDVFDEAGTLVQTRFHISLHETDTNSVTGKTFSLKGHANEVWDWASNTRTITGVVYMGKTDDGKAFQDTGRIVMSIDTRVASFVAGPHDVFFGGGLDAMGCALLAAA